MDVKITRDNGITEVAFFGRLDTPASQEFAPMLEELKNDAAGTVVLDCKELSYISSSGLRIFLTLRKTAAEKGGKIIIRSIGPEIRAVFMMTGFLNLFEIE